MNLPTNPDVIVVGAGAAGLSAAKTLIGMGFEVAVLEANSHVGGRCVTDLSTFETPFDRGGSWLHSAAINPLARIAEERGERFDKDELAFRWVQTAGKNLNDDEIAEYTGHYDAMWEAIAAAPSDADRPVEACLPASPWRDTVKNWVAQMQGADADRVSAADVNQYEDAEGDWLVEGGLGAFVARVHDNVPVMLDCPVLAIDYSGSSIRATTPKGAIEARYLVVTVSTGVLAAENIAFHPPLPLEKQKALDGLPLGLLNKVGFEFDPAWAEAPSAQMADYARAEGEFCTFLFSFYGGSLGVAFMAGRFADQIEADGPGAATEYALSGLKSIFGNDVTKHIRQTSETAWRSDPAALGSYSYAKPHCADARKALAAPVADRIFFAGEATSSTAYATVHGAYLSGIAAARAIARVDG